MIFPPKTIHTTAILAMSADGKIADFSRSPARFGSIHDQHHLQKQIAEVDAVLLGNKTLHTYQTSVKITLPHLLELRRNQGKPPQPIHLILAPSGQVNPHLRFFKQDFPHGLLTTEKLSPERAKTIPFEKVIYLQLKENKINWEDAFQQLQVMGIHRLAVLGGGQLVSSLIEAHLINELWLTICPLILGGSGAPTPVDGQGFLAEFAPRLQLLEVEHQDQEVFLHYRFL